MEQIKGIKVNGVPYAANIGGEEGVETHITSPNGTDFLLKISDTGNVYGYSETVDNTESENLSATVLSLKDENMDKDAKEYKASIANGELKIVQKIGELHAPKEILNDSDGDMAKLALCINEFYANDDADAIRDAEHNITLPVSHNFVEIANLNQEKIYDLSNVSLQYYNPAEKDNENKGWHILQLKGYIKPGSTYLIRGAKVANSNAPSTVINVDTFDMEWYEDGKLMAFNNSNGTLYLSHESEIFSKSEWYKTAQNPAAGIGSTNKLPGTYLDLIGWGNSWHEGTATAPTGNPNYVFVRRNMLDRSSQALATKVSARTNTIKKFWEVIDLSKNVVGNESAFKPCCVKENKNIYTTRSDMREPRPYCVTVTFGIDPTTTRCFNWVSPGIEDEFIFYRKKGETNWTIKQSYKKGDGQDLSIRSKNMQFANGDEYKMSLPFYDRIYWETSGGKFVTSHKVILKNLENELTYYTDNTLKTVSGTPTEFTKGKIYECCVGRAIYDRYKTPIAPNEEHCSPVYEFQVRPAITNKTWRFIQHSDEQGFNDCEYQVWRRTANIIRAQFNPQFTIDTGDMTQNGNRLSEWLDYNTGIESLSQGLPMTFKLTDPSDNSIKTISNESAGVEQMNVIGNNDLCPMKDYVVGNGKDAADLSDLEGKVSTRQFKYFYCYELDVENLPCNLKDSSEKSKVQGHESEYEKVVDTWIPSCYSFNYNNCHFTAICSEITPSAAVNEFGEDRNAENKLSTYSKTFDKIIDWLQNDLNKWYSLSISPKETATYPWAICYMHEMPWTILTSDYAGRDESKLNNPRINGCKLNDFTTGGYRISEIFQNNRVRLVIGGHKHTHSHSWPMAEQIVYKVTTDTGIVDKFSWEITKEEWENNKVGERSVNSSHPIVVIPNNTDQTTIVDFYKKWNNKQGLTAIGNVEYPNRFALNANIYQMDEIKETWLPIYIMSQASANKVVSNKEKPASSIPFLHYYYPEGTSNVDSEQLYPHFVEYEFVPDESGNPDKLNVRHYRVKEENFCNGQPYSKIYGANESADVLATGAPLRYNDSTSNTLETTLIAPIATTLKYINYENSRTLQIKELKD